LNNIRQRVGTISAVGDWHAHTAFVNPAGDIVRTIRRRFHPELCTRAFCKFYELLSHYPQLVPTDRSKTSQFRFESISFSRFDHNIISSSLHLCEAPGAFISALNQFIVSHRHNRFGWQWLATTLNPYNEANNRNDMLTDDSLIFGTIDRWHFGDDDTGDLLMFSREYMLKLRSTDGFDLVTADGSTSCIVISVFKHPFKLNYLGFSAKSRDRNFSVTILRNRMCIDRSSYRRIVGVEKVYNI
jgi:cap2 methyltransferase